MTVDDLGIYHEPIVTDLLSYDIESLSISISNSVLCILDNSFTFLSLEWLKWEEFELKLLSIINNLRNKWYDFDKIDISWINSKDTKREISSVLSHNYPTLEISRLLPWEKVSNISFTWIKNLNDISYQFTDLFIWKLKKELIDNFDNSLSELKSNWRLIRSSYKHLTFSFDSSLITNELIFNEYLSFTDLIYSIFEKITDDEISNVVKWWNRSRLFNEVIKHFRISVWTWIVNQKRKNSKMIWFYEAEMSSRDNKYDVAKCFDESVHSVKSVIWNAVILENIEKKIISNYLSFATIIDWVKYKVVDKNSDWDYIINKSVLRAAKKDKKVSPYKLDLLLLQYSNILNDSFDFIAPSLTWWIDRELITELNNSIKTGIIETKYIEKNYKWTYTKNALESYSEWKWWINIFIDIIDMSLMNADDFKLLAERVSKSLNKNFIYWELLKAWDSVTKKFLNFILEMLEVYPNMKIALWWDEIFIFVEWNDFDEFDIDKISERLKENDLKWRICESSNILDEDKVDKNLLWDNTLFDLLWDVSAINKVFEVRMEMIINKYNLNHAVKVPGNTFLSVTKNNYKYLFGNFSLFVEELSKNIIDENIFSFLKNNRNNILVSNINGFTVHLERDWDKINILI